MCIGILQYTCVETNVLKYYNTGVYHYFIIICMPQHPALHETNFGHYTHFFIRTIYFLVRVLNILTENGSYFCWQKYEPWFLLQTGMRVN